MKSTIALLVLAFSFVGAGQASAQVCPVGTYQWVDAWGNQTCRDMQSQQDVRTNAAPRSACPIGSVPSVDQWGNRTCNGSGSTAGTTYYDTSHGCPVGFHQWVDAWGNPTCVAN